MYLIYLIIVSVHHLPALRMCAFWVHEVPNQSGYFLNIIVVDIS